MPHSSADTTGRDPRLEAMLTERQYSWDYAPRMHVSEIDEQASLRNQVRLGQVLDKDTIDRYISDLKDGADFPGVMVNLQPNGKFWILDGNHRFQAFKRAGRKIIPAYIITAANAQALMMLAFEANTRHGLPADQATRIAHGLWLLDHDFTLPQAAKKMGLKESALRGAGYVQAAARRADEAGITRSEWDRLSEAVQTRLHQISTNAGFKALTKVAIAAKLGTTDMSKIVVEMNQLRDSEDQVAYANGLMKVYADRIQVEGLGQGPRGRKGRSARSMFAGLMGSIQVLPDPNAIVGQMTPAEATETEARVDASIARFTQIKMALVERRNVGHPTSSSPVNGVTKQKDPISA